MKWAGVMDFEHLLDMGQNVRKGAEWGSLAIEDFRGWRVARGRPVQQ